MPHYLRPPIVEAVFSVRFAPITGDSEQLSRLHETLKTRFAFMERQMSATFSISPQVSFSPPQQALTGILWHSRDRTRQLQVSTDSIHYNVIGDYDSWDVHYAEFWQCVETVNAMFPIANYIRASTRFINKIDAPTQADSTVYINSVPVIPGGLPNHFVSFLYRLVTILGDRLAVNIVVSSELKQPDIQSYIIDIDVACHVSELLSPGNIGETFLNLRNEKNNVFEAFITDASREMFNQPPTQ